MGVITAEWRKLWLPGLWLAAAVTTGCSWLLAAMMSGLRGAEQTLQLVPRFAALGFILLGVMAATGEYAGHQVLTTCAAMPCRAQVGAAKLATAAGALLTAALVTVLGLRLLPARGSGDCPERRRTWWRWDCSAMPSGWYCVSWCRPSPQRWSSLWSYHPCCCLTPGWPAGSQGRRSRPVRGQPRTSRHAVRHRPGRVGGAAMADRPGDLGETRCLISRRPLT